MFFLHLLCCLEVLDQESRCCNSSWNDINCKTWNDINCKKLSFHL